MTQLMIKVALTALIIAAVSELGRRNVAAAALLAALPIVSLLSMIWLYIDTRDAIKVAELSRGIFWMVLPTLVFFLILPWMLERQIGFWKSIAFASIIMITIYSAYAWAGRRIGLPL